MPSQLIGSDFPIKTPAINAIDIEVRTAINFMAKDLIK